MPRFALVLGGSALLLTSAAPPPLPAIAPPLAQDRGQLRCGGYTPPALGRPGGVPTRRIGRPRMDSPMAVTTVTVESLRASEAPLSSVAAPAPPPPPEPPAYTPPAPTRAIVPTPGRPPYGAPGNTERYAAQAIASIRQVAQDPVSTFSIDVDTGAYANVRRFLTQGQNVPTAAVRTEEMINYFRYDYPRPATRSAPFSVTTDVALTPWNPDTRLLRVGLRGYDVTAAGRPPANLVVLVDVSGSMADQNKLPLVRKALTLLADRLTPKDRVSIVVYAGAAGVVLEPTHRKDQVRAALECLEAGGSTAGGSGITLAYAVARANRVPNGINRILLATDGDFNVGVSDNKMLEELVRKNRDDGITLTTLGFGTGNYNEAMMERIADVGNGNYAYIDSAMEAQKVLDDELSATLFTIAKDVKIQVEFNPAQVREYRLIGYENRALAEEDFANDAVDAGDIGAGHQVTALYEIVPANAPGWTAERRYEGNRAAPPARTGNELGFVKLRYKLPGEAASKLIERAVPASLMTGTRPPRGDMAFVTAVAAFGQRLRDDKYLNGYGYPQIATLAGTSDNYWRSEFGRLVRLADSGRDGRVGAD
jgi:Ca-activated chloride channel homolog